MQKKGSDLQELKTWISQDDWAAKAWLKSNRDWEKNFLDNKDYLGDFCQVDADASLGIDTTDEIEAIKRKYGR